MTAPEPRPTLDALQTATKAALIALYRGIHEGHVELNHWADEIVKGDHEEYIDCPEDDTCTCQSRAIFKLIQGVADMVGIRSNDLADGRTD